MKKHISFLWLLLSLNFVIGQELPCDSIKTENEYLIFDLKKLSQNYDSLKILLSQKDYELKSKVGVNDSEEENSISLKNFMHVVFLQAKEDISKEAYKELLELAEAYQKLSPLVSSTSIGDLLQMGSVKNVGTKSLVIQMGFHTYEQYVKFKEDKKRILYRTLFKGIGYFKLFSIRFNFREKTLHCLKSTSNSINLLPNEKRLRSHLSVL